MTDKPAPPAEKKPRRRGPPRKRATKQATTAEKVTTAAAPDDRASPAVAPVSAPAEVAARLDPAPLDEPGGRGDAPAVDFVPPSGSSQAPAPAEATGGGADASGDAESKPAAGKGGRRSRRPPPASRSGATAPDSTTTGAAERDATPDARLAPAAGAAIPPRAGAAPDAPDAPAAAGVPAPTTSTAATAVSGAAAASSKVDAPAAAPATVPAPAAAPTPQTAPPSEARDGTARPQERARHEQKAPPAHVARDTGHRGPQQTPGSSHGPRDARPPDRPGSTQGSAVPRQLVRVPLSVRWRDLDAFNHVNNSKYLSYLEEARLRWMLSIPGMGLDEHVAPVVAASNLNYRRPIGWPGDIVVELFVERIGSSSVTIGHRIVDANDGNALYCDGNVVMVWIDRESGRAAPLPESVRTACR